MRPARSAPAGAAFARLQDPIVAVASAPGRGAVGIVRASGAALGPLIEAVCGRTLAPRHATLLPFRGAAGEAIDRGLAIHFPAPHSYTGEEVLELHGHGGPVVLQLLLARCLQALPGARVAEPGEFTLRAFLNDKLDLAQAEAVADLIDASTEAAARSAGRALEGEFSRRVDALAAELVQLRTIVEATLDFPEEDDVAALDRWGVRQRLVQAGAALDALLAGARQGALLREGLRVVIAGQPNVGKSSLLNALAGAELAIVTPTAGTTRDRVSETIQIEGVPVHVTDTAGLRGEHETHDEVERIGIGRSWQAIGGADTVLFLHDLTRRGDADHEQGDRRIAAQLPADAAVLHVYTKRDLAADAPGAGIAVSSRTGDGLGALRAELLRRAGWTAMPEGVSIARTRHVQALQSVRSHLVEAQHRESEAAPELMAEELRLAHEALASITGAFTPDELLGQIFGRFCIGK